MKGKNNRHQVRIVDGIRVYEKAGVWYCDYNNYLSARQGRPMSIEGFVTWCEFRDLMPTG